MYADIEKYIISEPENINDIKFHMSRISKKKITNTDELIKCAIDDCDGYPTPGKWYWIGIHNFISLCEQNNYEIICQDIDIDKTNPITYFMKK